jgi:putative sigma-54 modulation protein
MIIEYTGRHTTVYPKLKALTEAAMERVDRVTECTHAHVILSEDKYRTTAEVTLQCRGESIVSKCESDNDMEKALHDALAKVETQAVKHKAKMETMRARGGDVKTMESPAA